MDRRESHPLRENRRPRGHWSSGPFVRPREPFVDLPSLGRPTEEERHRRLFPPRGYRGDHWAVRLRAITFEEWGRHLAGGDIPWALRAVRYLRHILARQEERIIRDAIERGWGWDEIGSYLGVSRQAVAKRWGRRFPVRRCDEADGRSGR